MDDETPRLRALLDELHGELSHLSSLGADDARRSQLLELKSDIERLLARREAVAGSSEAPAERVPAGPGPLQERLQSLVASFEGAHPRLASALEQTANTLSNMGL